MCSSRAFSPQVGVLSYHLLAYSTEVGLGTHSPSADGTLGHC